MVSFILRIVSAHFNNWERGFDASLYFLAAAIIFSFTRILQVFLISPKLGPLLVSFSDSTILLSILVDPNTNAA